MAEPLDEQKLIAEFDAFVTRAQLPVPPDRRDGLIATFKEMRDMLDMLRHALPPSAEPSGIFDVASLTRQD